MKLSAVLAIALVGAVSLACASSKNSPEPTVSPTAVAALALQGSPTPCPDCPGPTPCPAETPCPVCPEPVTCPTCPTCPVCPTCPEPVTCPECLVAPQPTPCPACPPATCPQEDLHAICMDFAQLAWLDKEVYYQMCVLCGGPEKVLREETKLKCR
jgi:hypothetical protein